MRYRTHLEGEVDTLRAHVNRLQVQVEKLHDELREARIARDHAQEEASTERARYLQMLQEFSHRYDRLLAAPRSVTAPRPLGPRAPVGDALPRGEMRRRIVALLQDHPEGLTPTEIRALLGVHKRLADTCLGMLRDGLLRRVGPGRYVAVEPS